MRSIAAGLVVCLGLGVPADAAPSYLFTGSGLPQDQGWLGYTNGGSEPLAPPPVITTQNTGSPGDVFSASTSGSTFNEYMIYTESIGFFVSMNIAIASATHNLHDGGLVFSPIGRSYPINGEGNNNFVWNERSYGLYIDEDGVGFLDDSQSFLLDTSAFHEYSILYYDDVIELYIDQSYESIMNGTATPVFEREVPTWSGPGSQGVRWNDGFLRGAIVFGDTTNDPTVNSSYALDAITFEQLVAVPEPSTGVLLALGLAMLRSRRRGCARRAARGW